MQDNKNVSPSNPKPAAQVNSQGQILVDITLPGDQLKLEDKPFAKGTFGEVYVGKWGNRPVAVKKLLQTSLTESEKETFMKEASALFPVSASSENVVRLFKITIQPYYSLVMELMPKGNLFDLLQNNRSTPLLWEVRYRLAMDISTGLSDIHSHSILHCDLKSLNVLLDTNLRAKLADFGLASIKKNNTNYLSRSGGRGTVQWTAPEVLFGGKNTEASDIYSLGMIFWELVTHRVPFADMADQADEQPTFRETIPEDCPKDFRALILDCWSAASKRPRALQVADRLQPLLENKPVVPTAAGGKLGSLTSMQLKGSPAYQPSPSSPVHVSRLQPVGGSLGSLTSVRLKGGPTYQTSSSSPAYPTPSQPLASIRNFAGEQKPSTAAAEHMLLRQQEAEAELARQKVAFAQQQAEMKALKKQMAQLMQAGSSAAPPVNPKPLSNAGRNHGPGFFEQKQSPAVKQPVLDEEALGQLLKFVAEGEQDQAEALIKKDSKLLLAVGKVIDLSGRTFDNITAFQYALWAMDYHMWTMIQKYLSKEAQAKQHAVLESKGTAHGKHFDLQPLLGALHTYVVNYDRWNYDQRAEQWCKKVGGAQKLLPAHVVNEYCRPDRPFDPCPTEWTSTVPRTRAVGDVWDGSKYVKGRSWFEAAQLGLSFAFVRGEGRRAHGLMSDMRDRHSLQALWNARTQQLKLLADSLVAESQSTMQVSWKL